MASEPIVYDPNQARNQVGDALVKASVLVVDNPDAYLKARELRRMAKLLLKAAEAHYKKMKQPLDVAKKAIIEEENKDCDPMALMIETLDPRIIAYEDNEEKERERLRCDLQERSRKHAQEARDQQIAEYEKAGNQRAADDLRAQPLFVPPVVIPESKDFLDGEGRNESWSVDEQSIDVDKLADAVAAGRVPKNAMAPNMTVLNGLAKTLKESFDVPGCKAVRKRGITQR